MIQNKCSSDLTLQCEQMDKVLDSGFVRGLSIVNVRNRTSGMVRPIVTYADKSGTKATRHVVNFCPFCGTEIKNVK